MLGEASVPLSESPVPRSTNCPGKVYLVGAGPGDPWLLTRKGELVLSRADVVVYDHLASSRLLDLARPDAVRVLAGKSVGHCILNQEEINELLIGHARAGRVVVRLKGGDPLVFGRGGEEAWSLHQAGVPFEIVPGVTAGLGALAYAGIPVTHREASSAVAFVTGHGDPECEPGQSRLDWSALGAVSGYARRLHGSHSSRGDLPHLDSTGETWRHTSRGDRIGDSPLAAHSGRHPEDHCCMSPFAQACAPLLF